MSKLCSMIVLAMLLGLPLSALSADPFDGWRIVGVSAADRVAVARSPQGELRVVREGDQVGTATIVGFEPGRVVLEAPGEWSRVRLFVSVADGRQQVARLERQPLRKGTVSGAPAVITTVSKPMTNDQ